MNISKELLERAKSCENIDEFKELSIKEGYSFNVESLKMLYSNIQNYGELGEDELDNVTGGACNYGNEKPEFKVGDVLKYGKNGEFPLGYVKVEITNLSTSKTEVKRSGFHFNAICFTYDAVVIFSYQEDIKVGQTLKGIGEFELKAA